jgi:CrcB protein
MASVLLVALGGSLGAVARYGLGRCLVFWFPGPFPWPTFVINFLGCGAIGWLMQTWREQPGYQNWILFTVTGFLGAFTTFSTFGWETVDLVRRDQARMALLYVLASVVLGLLGVGLGIFAGRPRA